MPNTVLPIWWALFIASISWHSECWCLFWIDGHWNYWMAHQMALVCCQKYVHHICEYIFFQRISFSLYSLIKTLLMIDVHFFPLEMNRTFFSDIFIFDFIQNLSFFSGYGIFPSWRCIKILTRIYSQVDISFVVSSNHLKLSIYVNIVSGKRLIRSWRNEA